MDGSGSVGTSSFSTGIDFLIDFVNRLTVGPDNTLVTALQFSNGVSIYGNPYESVASTVVTNLNNMRNDYMRSWTYTHHAIYWSWWVSQQYGRTDVPQVVLTMTDGKATQGLFLVSANNDPIPDGHTRYYAPDLFHNYGIISIALGVGTGTNVTELEIIASDPDDDHLIEAANYNDLDNLVLKIGSAVCTSTNNDNNNNDPDRSIQSTYNLFRNNGDGVLDIDIERLSILKEPDWPDIGNQGVIDGIDRIGVDYDHLNLPQLPEDDSLNVGLEI